jgi:hypothetical protein
VKIRCDASLGSQSTAVYSRRDLTVLVLLLFLVSQGLGTDAVETVVLDDAAIVVLLVGTVIAPLAAALAVSSGS